VTLIADRSMLV